MTPNSPQDPQDQTAVPPDANENTAPMRDPLDLFRDEASLLEMIRAEDEAGGEVGAGRNWDAQLGAFMRDPVGMETLAQLRDWMLKEFRLMLIEWDLGVAVDAIHPIARKLVIERFRQPSISMQDRLWHLFEQIRAARSDLSDAAVVAANVANREVRRIMVQTLTEEDWQAMTQAATSTLEHYLHDKLAELSGDESVNDTGADR